jgi:hypothetical protein
LADVETREFILIGLGTSDLRRARKLRDNHDRELERLWLALKRGGSDDARERYLGAIERAKIEGFEYRAAAALAEDSLADLYARIRRLEELGALPETAPGEAGEQPSGGAAAADALLGGADLPRLRLSTAAEEYFAATRDQMRKKSPNQLRRWKNPREKALHNLVAIIGDKPIDQVSRADARVFRSWWVERVLDEGYTPNSANKDIGHLAQIFEKLSDVLELDMANPSPSSASATTRKSSAPRSRSSSSLRACRTRAIGAFAPPVVGNGMSQLFAVFSQGQKFQAAGLYRRQIGGRAEHVPLPRVARSDTGLRFRPPPRTNAAS